VEEDEIASEERCSIAKRSRYNLKFDKQIKLISSSIQAVLDANHKLSGLIFCNDKPYKSRVDLITQKREYPNSPKSSHPRERLRQTDPFLNLCCMPRSSDPRNEIAAVGRV
jgi:hypothetical protein